MFNIGDCVVYRRNICKIKEIKKNNFNGKDYYVLMPIDDNSLVIDVPVENKFGHMKNIIDKKSVEELINDIPNIKVIKIDNEKNVESEYKKLLVSNHSDLIRIIKTTYLRNKDRIENKKKISETDDAYFKIAEKMLYNEFSIALNMSFEDTKKYVTDAFYRNIGDDYE